MIDALKPYDEYQPPVAPWLDASPVHWRAQRVKRLFKYRKQLNADRAAKNILSLTLRGVVNNNPDDPEGLVPKDYGTYQLFRRGDLVFKLIDLENVRTSRVGLVHEDGIMSPAYVRLEPMQPGSTRYFYHQFYDLYSRAVFNQLGAGVRSTLGPNDLLNLPVLVPPPEEQQAIVRFLDDANGRLEWAIRAKRKVIALLNEQKQAIIHRAVTRGLPSTGSGKATPLKPSGLPWLGDIPAHWEVRPIKQLLSRMDYGTSENGRGVGRIRMLTMGHIQDGRVICPNSGSLEEMPSGLVLEKGDLLFNRTNSPELVGKVGFFDGDVADEITFASYLVRLRCRDEHCSRWLAYLLNSVHFWAHAKSQALVSLHQANLSSSRYGRMLIPTPSTRTEQELIANHIQIEAMQIDTTSTRLEREITLLREYRKRLVADVVTGRLDVRPAAASLPEVSSPTNPRGEAEAVEADELLDNNPALP